MKKIIALTILILIIISYIFSFNNNKKVCNKAAFRELNYSETIYLDDEAIALAADSSSDTSLRSQALRAYNLVNEQRKIVGINSLLWDVNLEATSNVRAIEASQNFSHTRPNGSPWYTVNSTIMCGENLAYGFNDAESAIKAWMESPTHRDNILYDDFTKVAISIYEDSCGVLYWAQEFNY